MRYGIEKPVASLAKSTGFWRSRTWPENPLGCHHFDYTCGIVATVFAASVDVTGAANGWAQSRAVGLIGAGSRDMFRGRIF